MRTADGSHYREENNGEDRAERIGGDRRHRLPREKRQRAAAGASVESAVLRRYRHADRRRRHLVLPKDADRTPGAGQAVRLGAQARGRPVFPGHPGGESRDHRRRCPVPRRRTEGRAMRSAAKFSTFAPMSTTGSPAAPAMPCASSRKPDTGGLKPYLHVRRDLWAKVTRALFYDLVELGEEREVDGEPMFGVASGGEFFVMAEAERLAGVRLMDGVPVDERSGAAGILRARPRPADAAMCRPALDRRQRITPARGDHDLDPVMEQDRRGAADPPGGRAGAGRRASRADGAADAARPASADHPGQIVVSRRQDRPERRKPARRRAARGRGGDRPRRDRSSSRSAISISI